MAVVVPVAVIMAMSVISIVIAVQPARIVHGIQHARQNALPHINKYQARVYAK